ncbi:hypothetical protein PIROE2DRAFT_33230, partial [Piromyces sp. E2]
LNYISMGINKNECFGLLGPNGSGKSSLLDILTFSSVPTGGDIYYDGIKNSDIKEDHFKLGYCPQNDILWENLTLYEHLKGYLYIRGHSINNCVTLANEYLKYCKLEEHKNKYPRELSGGTKRKLCILLALSSFSDKVILDEPSSGMDPATRSYMWEIIMDYINYRKSSIILTTHSMEEAEILCNRVGILINGELKAIGSVNHLK